MSLRRATERSLCGVFRCTVLSALLALLAPAVPAATDVWCPHVTAYGGWKTEISVYASGSSPAKFRVEIFGDAGETLDTLDATAAAKGWTTVPSKVLKFEGSARVTSERDLLVKASYQSGDSPSVCEFFLTGASGTAWVLPNAVRSWMSYSGFAVVYAGLPLGRPVTLTLEAWKGEKKVAADAVVSLAGRHKYVKLSDQVWPGVAYADIDTIVVRASSAVPAPLLISGNAAGDRNLFFLAQPEPAEGTPSGGDLVAVDPVVGNLRYAPAGSFAQGSPESEPCRESDEAQFTHALTRGLAVMETEVTRQMWADLKAAQPTLPEDPTDPASGPGMANPVQRTTWFEAVLFANLLSVERGLKLCYYTDAGFSTPIDAANYTAGPFYCDWGAGGYRLPAEGEWEHFCRAGTTTPFSVNEPNYGSGTCTTCSPSPALAALDSVAWWCGNSGSVAHPAGTKDANPWNLKDVHGNVWEWCWDLYASAYPAVGTTDYRGAGAGSARVLRGGSWGGVARPCRSAYRNNDSPGLRDAIGFRLARGQ